MSERGLSADDVLVTDYSWEEGARATRTLLARREPPTAITFARLMALAGPGVARELGVAVPRDLSIVAGDDAQLCLLVHPSLTALSRDISAFGATRLAPCWPRSMANRLRTSRTRRGTWCRGVVRGPVAY